MIVKIESKNNSTKEYVCDAVSLESKYLKLYKNNFIFTKLFINDGDKITLEGIK